MTVSGATKKPLPRPAEVWMVTTAGITRVTRSSSDGGTSAPAGTASGAFALRSLGADSAGFASGGAGAGAAVETGDVVNEANGRAACRLFIHQTVPAIAKSVTASNVAICTAMDPADVCRSVIPIFSGGAGEGFRL